MHRVLLVSPSAKAGGAERALAGLARHLREYGWTPSAVLLENGPLSGWLEETCCPVRVLLTDRLRQLHHTALTVRTLARMIEQTRQDLVISNQTKGHLYGGSAARLAKVPAVFWQQGIPSASLMERLAGIVPARCIVASSEAAVKAQRAITPRRRVRRIPLGVLVEQIAHRAGEGAAIREVLGVSGLPTVGIVGRLQPWKGQDLFLRAAAQVAHRAPDVRFLVVGGAILGWEGSYPGDLERSVSESPELRDRVIFAGHQDDVYPWYDALDVVVHASTEEPFGLVLVEAMALGRPLVATGAAGPTEIVEHGVSGLLVPPGDASAMAQAIRSILDDVALARDLSAGAKARSEQFSARSMAARWAALLDEITTPP